MKKYNYVEDLVAAECDGYGCAHCGHPIKRGELMIDCPDCAAIFCEACVRDGTFENHQCEDYDWDDD